MWQKQIILEKKKNNFQCVSTVLISKMYGYVIQIRPFFALDKSALIRMPCIYIYFLVWHVIQVIHVLQVKQKCKSSTTSTIKLIVFFLHRPSIKVVWLCHWDKTLLHKGKDYSTSFLCVVYTFMVWQMVKRASFVKNVIHHMSLTKKQNPK